MSHNERMRSVDPEQAERQGAMGTLRNSGSLGGVEGKRARESGGDGDRGGEKGGGEGSERALFISWEREKFVNILLSIQNNVRCLCASMFIHVSIDFVDTHGYP